jgi:hypothetical protein
MRPRLLAAALLATVACASTVQPARTGDVPRDEDRATARAQEERANELEQSLAALSVAETPPDCSRACELVDQICDLTRRICLISGRHGEDADLAGRCSAATERCRRSRDRIPPGCSCAAH